MQFVMLMKNHHMYSFNEMYLLWGRGVLSSSCAGSGGLQEYLWGTAPPSPQSGCPSSLCSPGNAHGPPWTKQHFSMRCRVAQDTCHSILSYTWRGWEISKTRITEISTALTSPVWVRSCWPSHMCPAAWPGWDGPESAGVWSPAGPALDAAASC